jgi:hypothetical protein
MLTNGNISEEGSESFFWRKKSPRVEEDVGLESK